MVGELPHQPEDLPLECVYSAVIFGTFLYSPRYTVIVSHDSSFLNNTITDVLHLNRFKVKRYKGNLESFVKQVPEAKSYYTLEAAEDYKFKLPDPPFLEGVKTKEKSLLKM